MIKLQRMDTAEIRFYGDLDDFLPPRLRQRPFHQSAYEGRQSVKHHIESLGVPHTEVEAILANGRSVNFNYPVQAGDTIGVYPPFHTPDVSPLLPLRPSLTPPYCFILDNHLGKLARYLRLLGLDTLYAANHVDDAELAHIAHEEQRILLTRDRGLLKRSNVVYGYCLRTRDSLAQLTAVLHRYQLHSEIAPWTRCLRCNGLLRPVEKEAILHQLEPKTRRYFDEFRTCEACGQIYWQGSHFAQLQKIVDSASDGRHFYAE